MKTRTFLIGLGIVGAALVAGRVSAQVPNTRQIAIALVDSLSAPGLRAEILRFSDPTRADVILLRRDAAAPSDLAAAIVSYRASARRTPSRPGAVGRTLVSSHTADVPATSGLRARAAEMLAKVRREPMSRIGNYGRGRWSTFEVRVDG